VIPGDREPALMPSAEIQAILARAQSEGLVGPGDLRGHIEHALGFADSLKAVRGSGLGSDDRVVDLGAGGGLPGLVLASVWPAAWIGLVEGSERRSQFLNDAIREAHMTGHVEVIAARAELAARDAAFRETCTVVVSRSFGAPAESAECGSPFLRVGGYLVVSDPPESEAARWPDAGLAEVGLRLVERVVARGAQFAVLRQETLCPPRFPRRVGVPKKRPLFLRPAKGLRSD